MGQMKSGLHLGSTCITDFCITNFFTTDFSILYCMCGDHIVRHTNLTSGPAQEVTISVAGKQQDSRL